MERGYEEKIIIAGIILVLIGGLISFLLFFTGKNKEIIPLMSSHQYDATKEIQSALDDLAKEGPMAEIITEVKTIEKVVALTFQGLSDPDTNRQILDLITQYNRKADFFISGVVAAEDSNFVKELNAKGHRVGSNTLLQSKHMETYSKEELVDDFVRTNTIFRTIIKKKPTTLMCNSTLYTEDVLKAAYASGNEKVVKATRFLNYQSFKDYDQVLNYIKNLDKGAIITIKMDGVLDEDEYEQPPQPAKPAIDKQPGVAKKEELIDELTPQERLINIVHWLLKALEETDYQIAFVEDLGSYQDDHVAMDDQPIQPTQPITPMKPINLIKPQPIQPTQPIISGKDTSKGSYFDKEELEKLRKNNDGKKAKEYRTIYTTEQALSYTFYGIENMEVLEQVLDNLDILQAKGTFYITKKDMANHPSTVKWIAERGHEIGISLLESQDRDYDSIVNDILWIQKEVNQLTEQMPTLVRYPYDMKLNDEILEAVSSANGTVVWQDISIASSKVGVNGNLEEVMDNAFGEGNYTARRGYIIYYRMDYYKDPTIIPDAMLRIAKERIDTIAYDDGIKNNGSIYRIQSVGSIMKGDKTYHYPLAEKNILPRVKDVIYPGHLLDYTALEKYNLVKSRYIGNPDVSKPNVLPGFTIEELEEIDKTGIFTDDKVLFLTFDDWASDQSINQLLYVLDKYNVKGNFFIRTNYIQNNPNILRAIAEAGHDVGSHTDNHLSFAITENKEGEDDTSSIYYSPNEEEIEERKRDLQISYSKLQEVVGDISINDRPALTTMFRPPTLAMSRVGMEAILDMGFSYIVSGDFSTHDYEDTDPEILADKIINGILTGSGEIRTIQNGSILVMHMSDFRQSPLSSPNITAKALDIAIPALQSEGYRFARLSDYLGEE